MARTHESDAGSTDPRSFSYRGHVAFGWAFLAFLVLGIGGWSVAADLSGAIMAQGTMVVDRNVKKVQHRDGGIVAAINVQPGDVVKQGDVLIRLDDTQTRAEIDIVRSQIVELTGRKARLEAERDGQRTITFPANFESLGSEAPRVKAGETRLLQESLKTRESQREQLLARVGQLEEEIKGLTGQRDAKKEELGLIGQELEGVESLRQKQLTPATRVYALQRELTKLKGEHGSFIANIARAKGQITELQLQLIGIEQNVRSEAQKELRSIEARVSELSSREVAALDRLAHMDLKAPQGGVVHEMTVHTVGGVVTPAEPVMLIVPENEPLLVEARFSPTDRDQLSTGQAARLRFTAFNQRTTPEVTGTIMHLAADVTRDPRSGQSYYIGRLRLDPEAAKQLGDIKILPGMPVEAMIGTEKRTALSYFTKPFMDQFNKAFREQ